MYPKLNILNLYIYIKKGKLALNANTGLKFCISVTVILVELYFYFSRETFLCQKFELNADICTVF